MEPKNKTMNKNIKVFYTPKMAVDQGEQGVSNIVQSPSAKKPALVADAIKDAYNIEFIEPTPVGIDDFKLCHNPTYVDGVMDLTVENGFGNKSQAVVDTLPYTTGSMYGAALAATPDIPACALTAGFHHAGYNGWKGLGYFCTFNGLMVSAIKLIKDGKSVAIIDCDMHWGNGTDDILEKMSPIPVTHITFGKHFTKRSDSDKYLHMFDNGGPVEIALLANRVNIILYQAGADPHVDDPYGGVLTTQQMISRDAGMFRLAKQLGIPIAWDLAGGYQIDADGSVDKVIKLHTNTFDACERVYNL